MRAFLSKLTHKAFFGLARRLMLVLSSVILLCAVMVLAISVLMQTRLIEDRLNLNATHLASLIKEVSIPAILRDDPASLEVFFNEIGARPDIVSVAIVDLQGWVWMTAESDPASWLARVSDPYLDVAMATGQPQQSLKDDYLLRAEPIRVADRVIGFLCLKIARAPAARELRGLFVSTALIALAFLFIGPLVASVLAGRLSQPLLALEESSRRVASGDFSHRVETQSNDEFGLVAASFNNMLDKLHNSVLETKRVAYEDRLTGVPNRSWLSLQIENLTGTKASGQQFAILFLDVDRFKAVNDTHGHHIGDLLLRAFSYRVHCRMKQLGLTPSGVQVEKDSELQFSRGDALLSRLGGDEFTILVDSAKAERLAEALIKAMRKPFQLEGVALTVSTSIGIALYPNHATTREHLLKCADVAMYQAKYTMRGSYAIYNKVQHEELLARSQMEKDIEKAFSNDEFELFLQPKLDVITNDLVGAEALIRWNHPERGYVRPDEFLSVVSSMGFMPKLGELMIGKAIRAAWQINEGRESPINMAVNITSEEFTAAGFASRLERSLNDSQLDAKLLEIEITEGTAMEQNDQFEHNMDLLRELGVRLAVDDFGVGYSNLGRLKSLAFDTLKIDRSLIIDVVSDEAAQGLFQTVVDMAKVVNATVVAEGVETEEQLAFLRRRGVKTYQGYLGARPMPLCEFLRWAEQGHLSRPQRRRA